MQTLRITSLAHGFGALMMWPFHLARMLHQRQEFAQRRALALVDRGAPVAAAGVAEAVRSWSVASLASPFDLARAQYASAVQAGLIERSLLASGALERRLGLLERLTLGPWARRV